MKRMVKDVRKYWNYMVYSAKADLKSEVASSYLNWVWWVLEPLCFMFIYAFIFGVVFNASEQYFSIFIFIGLTMWNFFNNTVTYSVKSVKSSKAIVTKVYIPKYILIIKKMMVNAFKMMISFGIVFIMMIINGIPLVWGNLWWLLIVLTMFLFTFAISVHMQHFGVYVEDLHNVLKIVLRLVFYMSGIFYNLETRLPIPYNEILLKGNPIAVLLNCMRKALLYNQSIDLLILIMILLLSALVSLWGIKRIYENENGYAKVI